MGPGNYEISKSQSPKEMKSAFKSVTKREIFQKNTNIPPIGEYKLNQTDINYKLQKDLQFLKNLQKIEMYKPPFESNVPRFKPTQASTEP